MSKTTAITIIVVALLVLGGGLAYWYYSLTGGAFTPSDTTDKGSDDNLFPFGANLDRTPGASPDTSTLGTGEPAEAPQVREISNVPSSGFVTLSNVLTGPFVRYVEQETGHVYDAPLEVVSKKRVSNTTVPKTREVVWMPNGLGFIARYLGDNNAIQSFSATLVPPFDDKSEGSLNGKFLTEGINDLSLVTPFTASTTAKNLAKIFYLTSDGVGTSGFVANSDGTKATKVFTSPLNEWLSFPISESLIYLQTKSSGLASSFLYSLNTKTGALTRVLGDMVGLNALPNKKGDLILYSETSRGTPILHIYNSSKKTTASVPLQTFADKCVWSENSTTRVVCAVPQGMPGGIYPDAWYQGKVALSDDLWEINTETLETKGLVVLNNNSYFFDVEIPRLSDKDSYFVMRNKANSSLWSVRLPF